MLVLSRKINQRIFLLNGVVITFVDVNRGKARIGIEAPADVKIWREEVGPAAYPKADPSPVGFMGHRVRHWDPDPAKIVYYDDPAPAATKHEDWGHLPAEPCRYCRATGKVYFLIDDGPEGRDGLSPVRCDACGRSWVAGSSSA